MSIRKNLIMVLILLSAIEMQSQSWWRNTYSYKYLDINKINIPINNVGGLSRDVNYSFWEYNSKNYSIVYDHGPWIVGKINGFIHLAFEQWNGSYSPGPIINDDAAMNVHPEDSTKYRVYKIGLIDTLNAGTDYIEWPSEYGAEFGSGGFPVIYGHQTVWTVYNSADSSLGYRKHWDNYIDTLPVVPIEIHQIAYSYEWGLQSWLEDVVFFEWTIINKGYETIDSTYFGLWADVDFNYTFTNTPAVDSAIQLGYCWDTLDTDPYFIPMAVGHLFKYGPVIPSQGDSAIFKGEKKDNFKNIRLSSFHGIGDDSYPPHDFLGPVGTLGDAWNFAQGLDGYGNNVIDPITGFITKFPFSGDPVTGYGYIFPPHSTSGGAGYILFSGPFDFAPQDTQWVMAALIVSTGEDYKDAISKLKQKANILQNTPYDILVKKSSAPPPPVVPPEEFSLGQNFPNPFNNETKIIIDIPYRSRVILKVYNILGSEVAQILDEIIEGNHYEISFNGNGLASGVYFYQLFAEGDPPGYFLQTKKMILLK